MIKDIEIVPIWSSLGRQTIKVVVKTDSGVFTASSPTFLKTSKNEPKHLDVNRAVKKFQDIKKEFVGLDENQYDIIDDKLTKLNLNNIGANMASAISKACCKSAGGYKIINPQTTIFPVPMAAIVSGGPHGGYCSIKNFFVLPRAKTVYEAVQENYQFWKDIGEILKKRGMILGRSSEGAWIIHFTDPKTLDFLAHHASQRGLGLGVDFGPIYKNGRYFYKKIGKKLDPSEQLEFVRQMIDKYKLSYVQDPFQSNDFTNFAELRKRTNCLIVGDDLYSSQSTRFKKGLNYNSTNGIVIKMEKAGTCSRVIRLSDTARENNQISILSDRAEETDDPFLADLAVGAGVNILKYGVSGSEHISKINRLLEIWFDVSSKNSPEMASLGI